MRESDGRVMAPSLCLPSAASSLAAALMSPAPIIEEQGRRLRSSVWQHGACSSRGCLISTGSTLPRARTARASARPSAPVGDRGSRRRDKPRSARVRRHRSAHWRSRRADRASACSDAAGTRRRAGARASRRARRRRRQRRVRADDGRSRRPAARYRCRQRDFTAQLEAATDALEVFSVRARSRFAVHCQAASRPRRRPARSSRCADPAD